MSATMHAAPALSESAAPGTRTAAFAIAAATIVSTVFVALDRSGGGTTPAEILAGIAGLIVLKEVVHGVAIASVCAYGFGYATLARRLGLQRPGVLAALIVYLFGCVAMIGATLLDGFVTPHVALDAAARLPPGGGVGSGRRLRRARRGTYRRAAYWSGTGTHHA